MKKEFAKCGRELAICEGLAIGRELATCERDLLYEENML